MRLEASIHVLAGPFASQPLAFAHLLDAAQAQGLSPDLDHVEIVTGDPGARLRHYFAAPLAAELTRAAQGDALILVLPGALVTGTFAETFLMRDLGRHPGTVTRAPLQ